MSRTYPRCDKRVLGWLSAGVLSLILSSTAWGLDVDHEIARQETDSAQILSTLGRDKQPNAQTSRDTASKVKVQLIPSAKARKRR